MSEELRVARVLNVDELSERIYLRFLNGKLFAFDVSDASVFQNGQTVTVNTESPANIEVVPDELWEEESWVGVVHLKLEDATVVDSGSS